MRIRAWGSLRTERSHACTSGPTASRSPRSLRMSTVPLASSDRSLPQPQAQLRLSYMYPLCRAPCAFRLVF